MWIAAFVPFAFVEAGRAAAGRCGRAITLLITHSSLQHLPTQICIQSNLIIPISSHSTKVYTYWLSPLTSLDAVASGAAGGGAAPAAAPPAPGGVAGWRLQLVMEYCGGGSLRDALDRGALRAGGGNGFLEPRAVLAIAHDVAAAMYHLHSEGIVHGAAARRVVTSLCPLSAAAAARACVLVSFPPAPLSKPPLSLAPLSLARPSSPSPQPLLLHPPGPPAGDLKAGNVMLTGGAGEAPSTAVSLTAGGAAGSAGALGVFGPGGARRLTAKVADFGLALPLAPADTHATLAARGTPTHISPELFLAGRVSKASDVYAYGEARPGGEAGLGGSGRGSLEGRRWARRGRGVRAREHDIREQGRKP